MMTFESYRLPDGTIALVDATASKGAPSIDYTLKGGEIVKAVFVTPVWLTDDERQHIDTAIDSHVYWQLAEDAFKRDGYTLEPGSEDPEVIDEITEWSLLAANVLKGGDRLCSSGSIGLAPSSGGIESPGGASVAPPSLLAALKALRDNVEQDLSGYWTESTSNFMQMADQAIAAAEGK